VKANNYKKSNMDSKQNSRGKSTKKGLAKYLEENPGKRPIVLIGILLIIILICGFIFWGSWKVTTKLLGLDSSTTQSQVVSLVNVENITIDEAKTKLQEAGIKYEIEEIHNKDVEAGKVISQKPTPGSNYDINKNSPVKLVVSKGAKIVIMPKIKGLSYDEAVKELEKNELKAEKIEEISQKVEEGIVIKQEIAENKEINAGETVKVYVSKGNGLEKVTVPVVTNIDIEEAKKSLTEQKLEVNIIYEEDTSKSNGIVLKQSLEVGTVVDEGTTITLTVNKIQEIKSGTINMNIKSLVGYIEEKDEEGKVKKPSKVNVRVKVNEETIYNESVSKDTENINITPRGKGVITIKVYVDEVLKYGPTQLDLNSDNTILEIK